MAIRAEAATIHKAATDTRLARDTAMGELRSLYDTVTGNASQWQGQSGTTFQKLMTAWDTQSSRLTDAMDGIADLLDRAGTDITATDEAGQQSFNKFGALNE